MKKTKRPILRVILSFILKAAAFCAALFLLYLILLTFPQPFFRHHLRVENLTLYSDHPIPQKPARAILGEVQRRLSGAAIYDPKIPYRIFICNDPLRFAFFANVNYRAAGVNYAFNRNSFLRPSIIARDRLIGPSGREVPPDRTLTYFIAHEVTHGVTAARYGPLAYHRLPVWIREGYADYVAFSKKDFDFQTNLSKFRTGVREMDPHQSGLYLRYHLLVAFRLDIRHQSAAALFQEKPPQEKIEAEIRTLE